MKIPPDMLKQRRWMVRPSSTARAKLPQAAFDQCPKEYQGDADKWRYAWANPSIWASVEQAFEYWGENDQSIAGLCYVLHPADERELQYRLICLDFDGCIDERGILDPAVRLLLGDLSSYVEYSISGRGLHCFVMVKTLPFRNVLHFEIGNCKVDVLCSAQVAVTGEVFEGNTTLNIACPTLLDRFPQKKVTDSEGDLPDFWADRNEGLDPKHRYLTPHMEEWTPCIEGRGGDKEMYKASCFLARHGVTGWDAYNLLLHVEANPAFDDFELQHKVESAWLSTTAEEEFGVDGLDCFDDLPPVDESAYEESPESVFGFEPNRLCDLSKMDLTLTFAIDKLFVDKEGLFIGGREKCFKTGIAADLALSLVTGEPFLGDFGVCSTGQRVAFFTAEIGKRAAKSLFSRIARSKNVDPHTIEDLDIIDRLPTFQLDKNGKSVDPMAIAGLKHYFDVRRPTVAVFDPLYLAMTGANVGDMYAIGGVLQKMDEVCRKYDVWPIYCHHAKKDATKEYQPMQLGDLYGSGVSAFARQWMLLAHAEPYENGTASLYAKIGGSAVGDAGLWRIGIEEGMTDELVDRRWGIQVSSEAEHDEIADAEDAILDALRYFGSLQTISSLAMYADVSNEIAKRTLVQLVKSDQARLENSKFVIKD